MGRGTANSNVLYGPVPPRESAGQRQARLWDNLVGKLDPKAIHMTPDDTYMEDVKGFSGTGWWMVRRPELPDDLLEGMEHYLTAETASFKAQEKIIEHLLAQPSLQDASSQPVFETSSDKTHCRVIVNPGADNEAVTFKELSQFVVVETLAEEPGHWRYYYNRDNSHSDPSVYNYLIYLNDYGQLLGALVGVPPSPISMDG